MSYSRDVRQLMERISQTLDIDLDSEVSPRRPTLANSMFLTHKEQGDWAEELVIRAINEYAEGYHAVACGRSDALAAGDEGFEAFFKEYVDELNSIGKRPDILIFKEGEVPSPFDPLRRSHVRRAVVALEVRSSSFLASEYERYMRERTRSAEASINALLNSIRSEPFDSLLQKRKPAIHRLLETATEESFRDLDFRLPSLRSTSDLRRLTELLRELKRHVATLHKRDYLSITPKVEDLMLVNRWIQAHGVRHCYLQVFFDKAYVIPFKTILELIDDTESEDVVYSIETDVKNQGKATIKIDVEVGSEILGKVDMPRHRSRLKRLARGRLLYYVSFSGGHGYLDHDVFTRKVVRDG